MKYSKKMMLIPYNENFKINDAYNNTKKILYNKKLSNPLKILTYKSIIDKLRHENLNNVEPKLETINENVVEPIIETMSENDVDPNFETMSEKKKEIDDIQTMTKQDDKLIKKKKRNLKRKLLNILKINHIKNLKKKKHKKKLDETLFEKNIEKDNNESYTEVDNKKEYVSIGTDPIEMISKGTQIYSNSNQPGKKRKFKNVDTSFYEEPINNKKNKKNLHKSITINTSFYPELFSNKLPLNNSLSNNTKIQRLAIAPNIRLTRGNLKTWENF